MGKQENGFVGGEIMKGNNSTKKKGETLVYSKYYIPLFPAKKTFGINFAPFTYISSTLHPFFMRTIDNLTELQEIYQSENSIVLKGLDQRTGSAIAVKMLNTEYPSNNMIARFNEEAELSKRLDIKGVRKVIEKRKVNNHYALIMEYVEGASLQDIIRRREMDVNRFLHLAINISNIIGEIHKCGVIHKDVNPRNMLIGKDESVYLIDFGIASVYKKENKNLDVPERLEGTLAYISPEQTGRMNHSVDLRSDLYSLGVTFYHMLTGSLPFETDSPIELVHSHIARNPQPPHEKNHEIPVILSKIILKLMAKNVHERYQTAVSLKYDLDHCLEVFVKDGEKGLKNLDFELGKHAYNVNFQIPEKLYGRESESLRLVETFAQTEAGGLACVLVAGQSGIGKTALIRELYKPVTEKRSYFISGKFDQFQRDTPYSAIISAINTFIHQLLGESDKRLAHWKREILEALGENAGVLTEVVPNLELIIGKQPEPAVLPPTEAQNRFNRVFVKFFKDLSIPKHSLVIFIDDWQWADPSSLQLFKNLMTDLSTKHLLFLAAYRSNEVSSTHPFMIIVDEMRKAEAPILDIELGELETSHIIEMLKDTFILSTEEVLPLAKLIRAKTSGNPFFVSQFLQNLYDGGHVTYSYERQRWIWNIEQVNQLPISNNVLDLMTARLKTLQPKTQELLQLASCIGANFSLKLLSELNEKSQHETSKEIFEALEQGFIVPSKGNLYAIEADDKNDKGIYFQFLHDRVQQAAYLMADETHTQQVSLAIGRSVYNNNSDTYIQQQICDIANYYNKGVAFIQEKDEKVLLADINLRATLKAKKVTAYQASLVYAQVGIELLGEDAWEKHFDTYFELYKQQADSAFLIGERDKAEQIFELLLENAKTKLQKIQIYNMKIVLYESSAKYSEAITTARLALKLLDIFLPEKDEDKLSLFQQEVGFIASFIDREGVEALRKLPDMQNEEIIEAVKILYTTWTSCYMANDMNLVLLSSAQIVSLAIQHGNTPETAWAYIAYATFVSSGLGNYELGYLLGRISIDLNENYNDIKTKGTIHHLMGIFIHHWRKPVREGLYLFKVAFESCVTSGNYGYAAYAHDVLARHEILSGINLLETCERTQKHMTMQYNIGNHVLAQLGVVVNAYVKNLLGKGINTGEDIYCLDADDFNEQQYLDTLGGLPIALTIYYPLKARLALLHNNYRLALEYTEKATPVMIALFGAEWNWFQNINYSLALCGLLRETTSTENEKETYLSLIAENQKQMKIWADNCPENFLHHYLTIEAELANIAGNFLDAMNIYDSAIKDAQINEFIQDEALACELAGKFYLKYEKEEIGKLYIQKAAQAYAVWGAVTKVRQLQEKYPSFFNIGKKDSTITNSLSFANTIKQDTTTITGRGDVSLDFESIMEASRTISQEIRLDALLQKLVEVLMENGGAERVLLIQEKDHELYTVAELNSKDKIVHLLHNSPLSNDDRERVALSIIRQVYRSKETVVSKNAKKDALFSMDLYIQHHEVKSVLCEPIVHQGKVRMVIYMEHNKIEGAFTEDRVKILNLLSAQVAISMENSILYDTMEQKITQRTTELAAANAELIQKNNNITSSIKYALRMQQAILPTEEEMRQISPDFFVLYLPKDIVSGDFYWCAKIQEKYIVSAIDCTGHGVPGAFMSMIANTLLDEIVNQKEITAPDQILEALHKGVRIALNQEVSNNNDGMDMGLCLIERKGDNTLVSFAGAKNPLYYVQQGEINLIEGDRRSIGGENNKNVNPFTVHRLTLQKGDTFYLSTDGYIDQAGGLKRIAFTKKRLMDYIKENWQRTMAIQKVIFLNVLQEHQQGVTQRDDITLLGFKV
jgi:predicted ATPase/serine phosphatase RsbU (regulator of sigma subunit)/predicted Ser/Thr protein kinase